MNEAIIVGLALAIMVLTGAATAKISIGDTQPLDEKKEALLIDKLPDAKVEEYTWRQNCVMKKTDKGEVEVCHNGVIIKNTVSLSSEPE